MNIINFSINKERKNLSKNKQKSKQFLLPSLNQIIKNEKLKNSNIPYQYELYNLNKNKQLKSINIQFQHQKQIQNKFLEQHQLLKNHKPYSGNPSIKVNNNIVELNKPIRNSNTNQ